MNGITEIVGCSGVGKTQLCLQLSLLCQFPEVNKGGRKKYFAHLNSYGICFRSSLYMHRRCFSFKKIRRTF